MPGTPKTLRTADGGPTTSFADGAGLIRRLAIDSGLTPDQADDVCFLTFQQAILDPPPDVAMQARRSGWLVRTAMEQCALVRRVAWQPRPQRPARGSKLQAVSP